MRIACLLLVLTRIAAAQSQDLGHQLPGALGLDAGTQIDQGIYGANYFVWYSASRVKDRHGEPLPLEGFNLDAFANFVGFTGTLELDWLYVTAAFAIPIVKLSVNSDQPEASIDVLGLGDAFIEPIKLGTRSQHLDVVVSYNLYAPTSQAVRSGPARPEWGEQFSAGGTVFFDDKRGWRLSALASYLHEHRKLDIDIVRGDSVQVQGGLGGPVWRMLDVGVAGYALWQVSDDKGADLPDVLRGARQRIFGVGPEADLTIPSLRSRVTARFEWDLDGKARPVGTLLLIGFAVTLWR